MKQTASSLCSALLLVVATAHGGDGGATGANAPPAGPPSMQRETLDELSATVTSVDPKSRMIELSSEDGRTASFAAGPEVKNFAQIHTGDRVVVSYYRGIDAQVLPAGTAASREVQQLDLAASAQPGAKPGAGVGSAMRGTVTVQKVDTAANTLTFLRPDGSSRTMSIESEEGRAFIRKLKKGDKVDVVYAEAVAVQVRPRT
jgi:Cu/Ag efflux protein CusF